MAIKKSELYSSLWASCDELRGGMDVSQYVLFSQLQRHDRPQGQDCHARAGGGRDC